MRLSLFELELFPNDNIYGFGIGLSFLAEDAPRSLLSFWWVDRDCFLSALYFNFNWTCLIGYKEESE